MNIEQFKKFHDPYVSKVDSLTDNINKVGDRVVTVYRDMINEVSSNERDVPLLVSDWTPLADRVNVVNDKYMKMIIGKFLMHIWTDACIYIEMPQNMDARFAENDEQIVRNLNKFMGVSWDAQIVISPFGDVAFRKVHMDQFKKFMMDGKLNDAVKLSAGILRQETVAWGSN